MWIATGRGLAPLIIHANQDKYSIYKQPLENLKGKAKLANDVLNYVNQKDSTQGGYSFVVRLTYDIMKRYVGEDYNKVDTRVNSYWNKLNYVVIPYLVDKDDGGSLIFYGSLLRSGSTTEQWCFTLKCQIQPCSKSFPYICCPTKDKECKVEEDFPLP